ncbi:MAG TPA: aminoacyl-tRNA hydrolase [Candidatus Paceibacterota bacterium]
MKWIIVGLGNPGGEYGATRHNTGRIMLEEFRQAHDLPSWEVKKPYNALLTKGNVAGREMLLIEPETMMNNSGKSLLTLVKSKKQAEQLVIIYDDLDLPLGKWKFSFNRGSGGHKGIESIARSLKTKAFIRVRVGIAPLSLLGKMKKPKGDPPAPRGASRQAGDAVVQFILGKFTNSELAELKKVSKEISRGLETLVAKGLDATMGEFN